MIELTFRYEPDHLKTYQRLASHRVEAKNTDYVAEWWRWMLLYTLLAGAVLACAYLAFPELTGRPFALCLRLRWRSGRQLRNNVAAP